ncbi:uncharacterized protein BXZ73DRAFT_101716 [Epithele typhae]|uniref:uncharacterized protein n=1 Tax=Epithele typhae TaxID=378194 RepID=UPI002008C035|nr:uncharacterized protein BXZ73DRAFT_101716 [Epithele typhae]KAH9931130.1 hypothetical protein BXZ73DRAFT_101716 [Epithele typhae]
MMQTSFVLSAIATALLATTAVRAETHTIRFENKCGKGTPQLIQGGTVLSTGQDYVHNGPFSAGIAYLQTGECLFNGEHCSTLEMTLVNPTAPGAGSSTDISLIAPHAFNVETSFSYFGGCDGQGTTCSSPTCSTAFFKPDDNQVQVQCESNDVNLLITFCGDATKSGALANSSSGSATPISSIVATTAKASTSTAAATSVKVTSSTAPTSTVAVSSTLTASSSASTASASGRCAAGSSRRRRRDVEAPAAIAARASPIMRRHHARNAEAVRGVTI